MKQRTVPIANVARLSTAADALLHRPSGTPGMGVVYGLSGLGKSTAIAWLVNQTQGIYVRAQAVWTPAAMFEAISEELGLMPQATCHRMAKAIIQKLGMHPRPIFVDEGDHIVDSKKMTESLRDVHDMTDVPVVFIGMERIMKKLQTREQLYNRLAQQVEFKRADFADARMLADQLCEVEVADDLLARMLDCKEVGGIVRRIVIALAHIEQRAKVKGLKRIDGATWGRLDNFFSGEAEPSPASPKLAAVR